MIADPEEQQPCVVCSEPLTVSGYYEIDEDQDGLLHGTFVAYDASEQDSDFVAYCEDPKGYAHVPCVCTQCGPFAVVAGEGLCAGCFIVKNAPTTQSLESEIGNAHDAGEIRRALSRHIDELQSLLVIVGGERVA